MEEQRSYAEDRRAALKQAEEQSRKARLQQLLKDLDEPGKHSMAIYCLNQYGSEAVESLIVLLKDDDPDARYGAAQTLGNIRDPRAIDPLIAALGDPEPAVRYWAADALGKLQAESAVEAIGRLLQDKHKGVKEHAAAVLRYIGGPKVEQLLKKKRKRGLFSV
jgi:HEAT repeat protein